MATWQNEFGLLFLDLLSEYPRQVTISGVTSAALITAIPHQEQIVVGGIESEATFWIWINKTTYPTIDTGTLITADDGKIYQIIVWDSHPLYPFWQASCKTISQ